MTSNIEDHSGLTDEVGQKTRTVHPTVAARNGDEDQEVRDAIDTLVNADTETIFLNYLALLPCLEKLGNDFLQFKRPGMLKDDSEHGSPILDVVVENFQKEVRNLQRYLTPQLALPQPVGYRRPREAALAYAEKCNPFKQDTMGTAQEQQQIIERLNAGSNVSLTIPQTPGKHSPNVGRPRQSRSDKSHADNLPLTSPPTDESRTRKLDISYLLQHDPRKRRKASPGVSASHVHVDPATQTEKRVARLPENAMTTPAVPHAVTRPSPYDQNMYAGQTSFVVGNTRHSGAQENRAFPSNIASQGAPHMRPNPEIGQASNYGGARVEGQIDATSNLVSPFRPGTDWDPMIGGQSDDEEATVAPQAAFDE